MGERIKLYHAAADLGLTAQRYKTFAENADIEFIRTKNNVFVDADDHERIKALVREAEDLTGLTPLYVIAERYGVATESVRRYLVGEGFDVHTKYGRAEGRWILAADEEAMSHIEGRFQVPDAGYLVAKTAAKRIGVPLGAVIHWMKANGKEVRYWNTLTSKKAYVRVEDWEEYVSSELSEFVPPHLAASRFGETTTAIRMLIDRYNLPHREVRGDKFVHLDSLKPLIKRLPKYRPRPNAMRNPKMGIYELSTLIKRTIVLKGEPFARALYDTHIAWRRARGKKIITWEALMRGAPR